MQELLNQKDNFLYPELLTLEAQKQKLKCPNNIQAFSVCINRRCKVAGLMCRNQNCNCIQKHYKCNHTLIDRVLDTIDKHRQQIPQKFRKSYKVTYQIINGMIDQLSKIRKKVEFEEIYFGLTEPELSFITVIVQQKIEKICGKVVDKLKNQSNAETILIIKNHEQIAKDFEKFKRPDFDSLCKHIEYNYTKFDINRVNELLNGSKIVSQRNEKELMYKWLSETSNKKGICSNLLFRASENNFNAAQFHKRCDGVVNTLIIVKTQFDRVIGGFTPKKWHSNEDEQVNDETGNSFLFSLTLKQKLACINPAKSIYCYKNRGPVFGDGHDLSLGDNAHQGFRTYANFPISYNLQVNGKNKYENNQETYTLFSGATDGIKFKVKQYEVYEIKTM